MNKHSGNLMVLDRLHATGLCLKPKKCCFALPGTCDGWCKYDRPNKSSGCQRLFHITHERILFLWLPSYYRKFIPNSKDAGPLHALTKKDTAFVWTPECQSAFQELKKLLTSVPLLTYPKFDQQFILETDTSCVVQSMQDLQFNAKTEMMCTYVWLRTRVYYECTCYNVVCLYIGVPHPAQDRIDLSRRLITWSGSNGYVQR